MHEQAQNAPRVLHSSRVVSERHAMVKPLGVGRNARTPLRLTLTLLRFAFVFVLMFCDVYFLQVFAVRVYFIFLLCFFIYFSFIYLVVRLLNRYGAD